jgi:hypothetical protein
MPPTWKSVIGLQNGPLIPSGSRVTIAVPYDPKKSKYLNPMFGIFEKIEILKIIFWDLGHLGAWEYQNRARLSELGGILKSIFKA